MSYFTCPSCGQETAFHAPSGDRCIPCGWNLVPAGTERSPEQSVRAAEFLSGHTSNYRRSR